MKITSVRPNNHRRAFEITVGRDVLLMPYARLLPRPGPDDPVMMVYVDDELGREAFTYELESGAEGSAHLDSVLEYNEEPVYMRDLLLYRLTVAAQDCMRASPLSQREITRRAGTSAAQVKRLLDPQNRTKSIDKLLVLLSAMDCEVDFTVRHTQVRNP